MFDPLQIPSVWRAQSLRPHGCVERTGFDALDAALGGGWPAPALLEILADVYGIGELQLILPLLRTLVGRSPQPALIVWLNPPYQPNAIALAQHGLGGCRHWLASGLSSRDALWSMEQALRSGACAAVITWVPSAETASLRRLRLAVSTSGVYGIVYRSSNVAAQASPAHVRLQLNPRGTLLQVKILKAQGQKPGEVAIDVDPQRLHPGVRS